MDDAAHNWKVLCDLTESTARALGYRLVQFVNKQGAKETFTNMIFDPSGNAVLPYEQYRGEPEPITLKSSLVRDHMKRHYGINLLEATKYSGGL